MICKKKKFPVIPTDNAQPANVKKLFRKDASGYVIKPRYFGECGIGVMKLSEFKNESEIDDYIAENSPAIVQPFMKGIKQGEFSLIFLGKTYSHGVNKSSTSDNFKINYNCGAKYSAYSPSRDELNLCFAAIDAMELPPHLTRIDLIKNSSKSYIAEVEMTNPSTYIEDLGNENFFYQNLENYIAKIIK